MATDMVPDTQPVIDRILRNAQVVLGTTLQLAASEARIEASMLLCRALGDVNRAWLIAHAQDVLLSEHHASFDHMLQRRLAGEPLAYILGEREFHGLDFRVTPAVLIPRPETELLVELALQRLPQGGRILDLGTGSGAVALSIAHARPDVQVTAVDASADALEVAHDNARRMSLENVRLLQSDWYSALHGDCFDLVVANPPYVALGDPHLQEGDLRFEPAAALSSGKDGLDDIRHIVTQAPVFLEPGGWLLLEHGFDQADKVREMLLQAGLQNVFSERDLSGIERDSGGQTLP